MTSTAQAPGVEPPYPAHEQEALLLVELLRNSRLSLLYAEAGSDKTSLLRHGLTPLLSRRAGDRLVPGAVRPSGVVVPFPDRRRSSVRSSKRRREIVIYFDDWTDTPLAALRESLYGAVTADRADRAKSNARLGGILDDLSQRFDCHFIVLLDRFEDLLQAPPDEAAPVQFANELAEAINHPQLAANFLIALAEGAKPRLAGLRSRIPGFDDSSLKLAPPRDFKPVVAPMRHQERATPAVVEALPVLTETVTDRDRAPPAALGAMIRPSAKRKVKHPLPRVEIRIEDVYTMIESALARIAVKAAVEPIDRDEPERFARDRLPAGKSEQVPAKPPSSSCAPTNGKNLQEAIEKMERR